MKKGLKLKIWYFGECESEVILYCGLIIYLMKGINIIISGIWYVRRCVSDEVDYFLLKDLILVSCSKYFSRTLELDAISRDKF
jgi:hypothetical protein